MSSAGHRRPPNFLRRPRIALTLCIIGFLIGLYAGLSVTIAPLLDPLAIIRSDQGRALGLSGVEAFNVGSIGFALYVAGYPWIRPERKTPVFNIVVWWMGVVLIAAGLGQLVAWGAVQVIPEDLREYHLLLQWGPEGGGLMADIFRAGFGEQLSNAAVPIGVGVAALALTEAEDDATLASSP